MSHPTSIRIDDKAKAALETMRQQPGGFNLNKAISQWIIEEAERRRLGVSHREEASGY